MPELAPEQLRWLSGGRLVIPSRTHEGKWYVTDADGGCSCPCGYKPCWHKKKRAELRENAVKALRDTGIPAKQITTILSCWFQEMRDE
jgi:hypothetical protein